MEEAHYDPPRGMAVTWPQGRLHAELRGMFPEAWLKGVQTPMLEDLT